MNPKSILVLSHELPPFGGGAGRALAELCAALARRNIAITVWTQKPPSGKEGHFPFQVRYFATGRKIQFQTSVVSIALYTAQVLFHGMFLPRKKFDLIFSSIAIPAGIAGAILSRFLKIPHVIWYHGADVHGNRRQGAGSFFRFLLRLAWKATDLHCFVSQGLLAMAEKFGGTRAKRAQRAQRAPRVVLPIFADYMIPCQPSGNNGKEFLFTGRLEKVKNPFLFLDVIESLRSQNLLPQDIRFKIVGGGSLFPAVRSRVQSSALASVVSVHEPVSGESMSALYSGAYAVVLTSVVEGYPLTVLEAAMCGVPSIGPDTLGVNEAIRDGETGILFAENDPGACGRAILSLVNDTHLRDRLGSNAQKAARGLSAGHSAALFLDMVQKHIPG
jgi:glycosyltransferase involved in cell wall biosynthesis